MEHIITYFVDSKNAFKEYNNKKCPYFLLKVKLPN